MKNLIKQHNTRVLKNQEHTENRLFHEAIVELRTIVP